MTADNVIAFPEAEIGYWVCACGCITHKVRSDGEIECASCGHLSCDVGVWRQPEPGPPKDIEEGEPQPFGTRFEDPAFSRRRFSQRVLDGEFVITVGMAGDGALATSRADLEPMTGEQKAWLRRRLDEAFRLITGER